MQIFERTALIALLLAPLAAPASDLTFQIDGLVEYDDNAFRQGGKQEDDVLFRIRPSVKLHEDRGEDLRYSLQYQVPFEFAVDNGDELDDIDHVADGKATYHVNDRLEFFASDSFRFLRSALRNVRVEDTLIGDGTFLINQERDRTTINEGELGMSYRFTPRLSGSLRGTHDYFNPERKDRADNWLASGVADLNYILSPKHSVGVGGRYIHQDFDDRVGIPGSKIDSYNVFAQWTYRHDETLSFSISAGPTLLDSEQDGTDAVRSVAAIPFTFAPAGSPVGNFPLLLVDPDGSAPLSAPTDVIPVGSIIVSSLGGCQPIQQTGEPFFAQEQGTLACPASPANPAILLDPIDDAMLITAAQTPVVVADAFANGEDDTRIDVFGEAAIAKHWTEDLHSALRYRRTQGGASGLGGSVIRDTVNLSNTWDFSELWQVSIRGDWSLRQTVLNDSVRQFVTAVDPDPGSVLFTGTTPAGANRLVTVRGGSSNEIDTMRYGVSGRLTRRFARNTSAWVQLTYNEQTSSGGTLGRSSDFENFLAVLGVRHVFDPIKLW